MRDLFTTGPGPDKGGSKPGQNGWVQTPEKSGVAAAPTRGACACPQATVGVAMANVTDRRNSRCCMLMIPSNPRNTGVYRKSGRGARPGPSGNAYSALAQKPVEPPLPAPHSEGGVPLCQCE